MKCQSISQLMIGNWNKICIVKLQRIFDSQLRLEMEERLWKRRPTWRKAIPVPSSTRIFTNSIMDTIMDFYHPDTSIEFFGCTCIFSKSRVRITAVWKLFLVLASKLLILPMQLRSSAKQCFRRHHNTREWKETVRQRSSWWKHSLMVD